MNTKNFIPLNELCSHYQVEMSFFSELNEIGLIDIITIKRTKYIHQKKIDDLEKIVRLHHELEINIIGIDAIFNLLEKLSNKENEIKLLQNKLLFYQH